MQRIGLHAAYLSSEFRASESDRGVHVLSVLQQQQIWTKPVSCTVYNIQHALELCERLWRLTVSWFYYSQASGAR